jgi:formate hydrogenlyase subunit 3/multisubunit Na+/H+ antiporter MnhD subunit
MGLLVSGAVLLGLPPLNGAMSHALIYQAAVERSWIELLTLLLGTILTGLGLVRAFAERLLGPAEEMTPVEPPLLDETELDRPAPRRLAPEPLSTAALTTLLMLLCLGIGLYPQPIMVTIEEAIRGLAFIRSL